MTQQIREPEKFAPYISEAEFFKRAAAPMQDLIVPELGGAVIKIKALTLEDRDALHSGARKSTSRPNDEGVAVYDIDNAMFAALTVIHGVLEPRIPVARVRELQRANPAAMDCITKAIWSLSGIEVGKKKDSLKNG